MGGLVAKARGDCGVLESRGSLRQHGTMSTELLFWTMVALWLITMARMTSLQSAIKKLQSEAEVWAKHADKNFDQISECVHLSG